MISNKIVAWFIVIIFLPIQILPQDQSHYNYSEIDRLILKTPKSAEKSMESLATYFLKLAKNDFEKVRAVYRWISENIDYDVDGYNSKDYNSFSAKEIFSKRKAICAGYSELFLALSNLLGLDVVIISGWGKGKEYNYCSRNEELATHSWNAVKLKGEWFLIDCAWGAGYLDKDKFIKKFEEFYFLTPPNQFIFRHFPREEKWQLLSHPISLMEFEKLPNLRPAFFRYNLSLDSHLECLIETDNKVNISLIVPDDISLLTKMTIDGHKINENYFFMQKAKDKVETSILLPQTGTYQLRYYAKRQSEPGSYEWIIEYCIKANKILEENIVFPQRYNSFELSNSYLYSPMFGELVNERVYRFKLAVPEALSVMVKVNDSKKFLKKNGDIYEDDIKVMTGEVGIYFQRTQEQNFIKLLSYKVIK